jgi:ABC-type dipeptide/oligopeptide/nickel transport system permease subunit
MRHRLAAASLVILTIVVAAGFLSGHIAPYGYEQVNIDALSVSPSWAHPFGTDQVGRDYFSRTLYGLGTEAEIALIVGIVGSLIGMIVGAAAGYIRRLTDSVVIRFADLLLTVPPLVTVMVAAAFLHTETLGTTSLLFACVLWMAVARVVRSASLVVIGLRRADRRRPNPRECAPALDRHRRPRGEEAGDSRCNTALTVF